MDFIRPKEGFPYRFGGVKTNSAPNTLPPSKYPYAQNLRSHGGGSVLPRPGQSAKFSTLGAPITDLRAFAALGTDNAPRILARDTSNRIFLDTGTQVGTLGGSGLGATFIPFRPAQSPQAWMYIANGTDYQKFIAPAAATAAKVGIAEPQSPPIALTASTELVTFSSNAAGWTPGGVAGATANATRSTENVVQVFNLNGGGIQGASPGGPVIIQLGGTQQYQVGEILVFTLAVGSATQVVEDVFPPVLPGVAITIRSIFYFSGSTGRCIVTPAQMPANPTVPTDVGTNPQSSSTFGNQSIASLRRGSLIKFSGGGAEVCVVQSVSIGPAGDISFEVVTANTHTAAETLSGVQSILVGLGDSTMVGRAVTGSDITSAISGAGTATLTQTLGTNPFAQQLTVTYTGVTPVLFPTAQQDDYIHFSINVADLTKLTNIRILFDVNNGAADFTSNALYFDIRPNDLVQAVSGAISQLSGGQIATQRTNIERHIGVESGFPVHSSFNAPDLTGADGVPGDGGSGVGDQTTLGTSQWSEVKFPLSSLIRIGNDQSRTLANCQAVQLQIVATAAVNVAIGSFWVGGGGAPDVGDVGSPYFYRVRPRSSITGARGNPSPPTRYGVSPRRQLVTVNLPSAAYDAQIDTWDIFRFGGSVTSWRYVGSAASAAGAFIDNSFDDAARAGEPLEFDNFEPWPTVDIPFTGTAPVVCGTAITVTSASANILRWLPGTLIILNGTQTYTVYARPTLISGTTYLVQLIENAGVGTNVSIQVNEPALANQALPYMFGPDAQGRFLAVGDRLRPGTLYYAKSNNPDSAPDTHNREIVGPSEPLLGGEIVDGRGWVASTEHWWELIPQNSDNPTNFYNPVISPIPRGLVAPFGHCTDGRVKYFWAKDGIWADDQSLTDADLYNLFPHEGVPGRAVAYGGFTIQPPDYSRAGTFRLAHSNGFLYATYQDSGGIYRTLTCDLHHGGGWIPDVYSPAVTVFYHEEQQAGTVLTSGSRYDETLMGTVDGRVAAQADLINDLGGAIPCVIAPAEFDGGDDRAPAQWGDFFVDLVPAAPAGVKFTPTSQGAAVAAQQTVASSTTRVRTPVTVGGLIVSDFMGLLAQWTEDYSVQTVPTVLNLWQPSYVLQPSRTIAWQSFGASYGSSGFGHIPWVEIAWVSTAPITLTIGTFDGLDPAAITIPSSSGIYQRALFWLQPNKGRLFSFAASSSAPFQIFEDDCIIMFGAWGRSGPYQPMKNLGVPNVQQGTI